MAGIWATRGRSSLERSPPQKIRASKSIVIELLERAIGGGERERERQPIAVWFVDCFLLKP